jgi:ferredoxin-NADP reductase
LRLRPSVDGAPLFRSYSLSGPVSTDRYRISVKIEPNGVGGAYVSNQVQVGDVLDVSSPRGTFVLQSGAGPVALLSAGIGVTPVLSMLYAISSASSARSLLWMHVARDGKHFPFAAEIRRLVSSLPHGRSHVCFSQPQDSDRLGKDFDAAGRLSRASFDKIGLTPDADVYLCGPSRFMADMKAAAIDYGVTPGRVHMEIFNGGESLTPGVVGAVAKTPHRPPVDPETGPLVSFARSGIAAHWSPSVYQSLLELAEACDVPVRWACRSGVCHNCESGLVSGKVAYEPNPLDPPAGGNLLICCSRPVGDVVLDL